MVKYEDINGIIIARQEEEDCVISSTQSLQDFIRECNRGNRVFFVRDIDEAIKRLKK